MNTIYFKREEFACRCGCGFDTVDVDLLPVLIDLRAHFNCPVYISSGCRCLKYNRKIESKDTSQHVIGKAADVCVRGVHSEDVYRYLDKKYPKKFGIGLYTNFVHIDVRTLKARW